MQIVLSNTWSKTLQRLQGKTKYTLLQQKGLIVNNIEFINTRFDPDVTPFHDLAKQMAKAVGYTADLSVEKEKSLLVSLKKLPFFTLWRVCLPTTRFPLTSRNFSWMLFTSTHRHSR